MKDSGTVATINGNGLKNHLTGTSLADLIMAYGDDDTVGAGSGNDTVWGGDGNDLVQGNDGADRLYGEAGNDTLKGDGGNDWLDGGLGADSMAGGVGDDTYVVDSAADRVVEGAGAGTDTVRTALGSYTLGANLENLVYTGIGSFAGTGNSLANDITGGIGADTLSGGNGAADTLRGGGGADLLLGSFTSGPDGSVLIGGAGSDVYRLQDAGVSANWHDKVVEQAGEGTDIVVLTGSFFDTGRDLSAEQLLTGELFLPEFTDLGAVRGVGQPLFANVENLRVEMSSQAGSTNAYFVAGNALGNIIVGANLAGSSQVIAAGAGNDTVYGGAGRDALYGQDGNDLLRAGANADALSGGAGQDTLLGEAGNDQLWGGAGDDAVQGGDGDDIVLGQQGNDRLQGGAGSDKLNGFSGNDTMTGGGGADYFHFNIGDGGSQDAITDFERGTDRLVIKGFDATPADAAPQLMLAEAAQAFGVWQSFGDAGLKVFADLDGDAVADVAIAVGFAAGSVAGTLAPGDFELSASATDYRLDDGVWF